MAAKFEERDLWAEAREKTRSFGRPGPLEQAKTFLLSLPGMPTQERATYAIAPSLGYDKSVVIPDLNLYRPGVNLKAMREEMGIKHLILRMGGPTRFVYDDWNLTEDPTYRGYFNDAVKYGYETIGGYIVYSAGVDAADYKRSLNYLQFVREITGGGYLPDYLIVDDEVNTWQEHGQIVTATSVNQVEGLRWLMPNLWATFKRTPMHYSAMWFLNKYRASYTTWLDIANKDSLTGGANAKTVLNWYAWYLSAFEGKTTQYTDESTVVNGVPLPTSTQINSYLQIGSCALYDVHQFTSTLFTPYYKNPVTGAPGGIDMSITRQSETDFMTLIGKTVTPPDDGGGSTPPDDGGELAARVADLELAQGQNAQRLGKLETWAGSFQK